MAKDLNGKVYYNNSIKNYVVTNFGKQKVN